MRALKSHPSSEGGPAGVARKADLTLVPSPRQERVQVIKDMLQQLENMSALHPEFERHLSPSIVALRREARRSPKSDRDSVFEALTNAFSGLVLGELADDTGLTEDVIRPILAELIEMGLAEGRPTGRLTSAKKGRIEYLFALTHKPAFTGPVAAGGGFDSATAAVIAFLQS